MIARSALLLGLTLALGACTKPPATTDGAPASTMRDSMPMQGPDTMQMRADSVRRDSVNTAPRN